MITPRQYIANQRKAEVASCRIAEKEVAKEIAEKFNVTPVKALDIYRSQFKFLIYKMRDEKRDSVRVNHIGLWFTCKKHTELCIKEEYEAIERRNKENPNWMLFFKRSKKA